MKPIPLLAHRIPLWDVACFHDVDRPAVHAVLGAPHHLETDELRTFGGEEDTWRFELSDGVLLFIELHVPYRHVSIVSNLKTFTQELLAACANLPGRLEVYTEEYPCR